MFRLIVAVLLCLGALTSIDAQTPGCVDAEACNYNIEATYDDSSCIFPMSCESCSGETNGTGTAVLFDENNDGVCDSYRFSQTSFTPNVIDGFSAFDYSGYEVFQVYVQTANSTDYVKRIFGNGLNPASIVVPSGIYNNNFVIGPTSGGAPPPGFFYGGYNAVDFDSWVGIGLTSYAEDIIGEEDVVVDTTSSNAWAEAFSLESLASGNYGPVDISLSDADSEGGWHLQSDDALNGFAGDDSEVIIMQLTVNEVFTWRLNAEIWIEGDSTNSIVITGIFDGQELIGQVFSGCADPAACNYNPDASADNGTCDYLSCTLGCTNSAACNYNPLALFEDGNCQFPEEFYNCNGDCQNDSDGDGICDELEVAGCTDELACNYNDSATDDDGSCAELEFTECGCIYCDGVILNDPDGDGSCVEFEIPMCPDPTACNYDPCATDGYYGSCIYLDALGICGGDCLADVDEDGVCDVDEVYGCTDPSSCCTYNPLATEDDGSCIYPGFGFDCCFCLNDTDGDGVCDDEEIPGCTDVTATNYLDTASDDDGTCIYAPDWQVTPTPSSGILLGHISVDGIAAAGEDWIGAFTTGGVCAGYTQPILSDGLAYVSLTIYGDDAITTDAVEGMEEGEDFTLQFFDASANAAYLYHEENGQWLMSGWTNTNGSPLPDYDDATREFAFTSAPYEPECGDPDACNYQVGGLDPTACVYPDPYENCDGNCLNDVDGDAVCDEVDPCVGEYDACGVCNGPGAVYDCGCTDIPEGDCDCDGNQFDECGVCGGVGIPEGACDCDGNVLDAIEVCGGDCAFDMDGDGICDDVDPCVGDYDACGVCNGPGAIYECGCSDIPETDCDCQGNQIDVLGVCGGGCQADADEDGICDDIDPCVGELDECGVCNGTGPAEGYDCQGNCLNDCDSDGVCDEFEVAGCVYEAACNYDGAATEDDGSCTYPEPGYNCAGECLFDADSDGVCDQDEITGCQDEFACNYDATATDAGYCDYPLEYFNCNGDCLNDVDGDGVCDEFEPEGCTNESACNFNPLAEIDNGSCVYVGCGSGCTNPSACNYDASAATDDGSCVLNESACAECVMDTTGTPPNENWEVVCISDVDGDGICDCDEVSGCQDVFACNYNDAATDYDGSCVFAESGYDCDGNCLIDSDGDGICDQDEAVGCQDAAACNYDESATDAGYCDYADAGYDCNGFCLNDVDEDGVCDEFEVAGCTAPTACNFAPAATDDNGSCAFPVLGYDCQGTCLFDSDSDGVCDQWEVTGCMDAAACNYDINATEEGLCIYPDDEYDCQDNCLSDADADGVCDALEVLGCTNDAACNFDCEATEEDGSCVFAAQGYDCAGNCVVDSDADGVCDQDEVVGCLDAAACNFDANATDEGYCAFPEPEYDCNGNCINDLDGDGVCDAFEISGCADLAACNFSPAATEDDSSCQFAEAGYACDGNCLLDSDGDGICDQNEVTGCQNALACNYEEAATDGGYCVFAEYGYDCEGNCTDDTDGDGVCDVLEVMGCVNSAACNFIPAATEDDSSCQFAEAGYACDGSCLLDSDGDGICDQNEVTGCLETGACNYNAAATDEGYCDYPMDGYDCNGECLNDADGDGLCDELEFLVEDAIAEELEAAVEAATEAIVSALANGDYCGDGTVWVAEWNECIGIPSCLGDLDEDGNRGTEDLLMLLSVYGTGCPEEYGCTDPAAENYNPVAVWDDGSCIVLADACMDQDAITFGDVNYELVVVNGACWFAQNLRSNQFANGDAIAEVTGSFDWYQAGTNDQPAYSIVSIDPDVSDAYGHYYNGHAILDGRNICPTDWHPATDEDWQALEVFLGMEPVEAANSGTRGTDQGTQLKAADEDAPAWDGTNTVGIGVLPTGKRYNFGSSGSIGSAALLWSPSAQDATLLTREFTSGSSQIIRTTTGDAYGATVRCVKNPE